MTAAEPKEEPKKSAAPVSEPKPAHAVLLSPRLSLAAAVLSGLLYWLAFAGMDVWPLAFVAFVPLWIALRGQTPRRGLLLGVITGATMNVAGFSWLLEMLRSFSGFTTPLCLFFMLIVCSYQGGRIGLMGWLYARAERRGWPAPLVFLAAFATSELLYPLLFPWYFAASVHQVPALTQIGELGGPILVGVALVGANLAIGEPLLARLEKRPIDLRVVGGGLGGLAATLLFGAVRIRQVDAEAQAAPDAHVGLVQGNMGLMQKRDDPGEGLRRHQRLTADLKKKGIDFVVWSESSVTFPMEESRYKQLMPGYVGKRLALPAIFGAVLYRKGANGDRERWFNTALSSDARGDITARYDKEFLLAFGEYLPLGDTFPVLYDWSPNSGKFSAGTDLDPLVITLDGVSHNIAMLICYEDILPSFTNKVVRAEHPELLVNMTNDAWFGDTSEPWEHLALAQLRAVEHRRYLVRSTNSGVSAFVDPVGRVMLHTGTFKAESADAIVHFMNGSTVYEKIGDTFWYLLAAFSVAAAFLRPRRAVA
jgi:apolipoprotein N-acyltransferase